MKTTYLRFAKDLRSHQTWQEERLWQALRNRRFLGLKFRRQQCIGPYIADFCCLEIKLIIEVDGSQHWQSDAVKYDQGRDRFLKEEGFRVLRIMNYQMHWGVKQILEMIGEFVLEVDPSPALRAPSPPRGEG